jgi:hypothetical protein
VESDAIVQLIRSSSSKDEFLARFPNLFLMLTTRLEDDDEAGFNTMVEEVPATGRRKSSLSRKLDLVEVTKAKGNPYPDRISVGRARNCDVVLRDPSVSKLHSHFRLKEDGKLELVDLKSQNGTCVNGRALAADRPEPVASGDVLLFGSVSARLCNAALLWDLLK